MIHAVIFFIRRVLFGDSARQERNVSLAIAHHNQERKARQKGEIPFLAESTYLRLETITGGDEPETCEIWDACDATEPLLRKRPTLRSPSLSEGFLSVIMYMSMAVEVWRDRAPSLGGAEEPLWYRSVTGIDEDG